ncbi:hypothetical protein CL176_06220 [Suicoccus acidiformans]|uniref:DUF1002 domain-containing protein n=1 Tax=Suicoccus acidiformans TaxID=2036206 RepID=A0A347WKL5_9LACT|nr:DUF1002 domain-containing protein [Suicoccus acidiformans]AXY25622.1 hypothetical protein CL176_06220 [Suicoccus acidiformans]
MNIRNTFKKLLLSFAIFSLLAPGQAFAKVSQLQGKEYASVGLHVTHNNQTFTDTMNRIGANGVKQENIVVVDGNMIHRYLNDGSNQATQVYSSSHIKFNNYDSGVTVDIVTPQNIQLVTQATYVNAAITSGIQNANITVGSEVPVTGEGALVGIYAIMEREGVLEAEDAQVAQEEITLVTEATNETGVEENAMNAMMADVKAEVAQLVQDGTINNVQGDQTNIEGDQHNTSINQTNIQGDQNNNYGTINNIVNVAMNEYGIQLPDRLVEQITQYLMQYATTESAQSPETLSQLGALANDLMSQGGSWLNNVSNEAQAKWNDEQFQLQAQGFFAKLSNGLSELFGQLSQFFSNLFNSVNVEELNFENPLTNEEMKQPREQAAEVEEAPQDLAPTEAPTDDATQDVAPETAPVQ